MIKEQAKKIFSQNNRAADVVRCPYGRANVRGLLHSYAQAAVELYGIISHEDFVDIFNAQNKDQTTTEEIYILLLPIVLGGSSYAFYDDYILHKTFFDDFEGADWLLEDQTGKPRYIPEKNEFLNYSSDCYADNDHLIKLQFFLIEKFGHTEKSLKGYAKLISYIIYGEGISELGPIMEEYDFIFKGEEQLKEFIDLMMLAKNNTRIWENNGYTPSELMKITMKRDKKIVPFPIMQKEKIGRNEPCPCGSGKKYKKCCALFDDSKTAQLSSSECRLFYETWYGLMGFINYRKGIVKAKIKPEWPNDVSDILIHKVREVLWGQTGLID